VRGVAVALLEFLSPLGRTRGNDHPLRPFESYSRAIPVWEAPTGRRTQSQDWRRFR
jgi:hypothetical protein